MTPAEAAELRGRLVFSNSQTFGRMGALSYYHLGKQAAAGASWFISEELRWALGWWRSHVADAKPRRISTGLQRPCVHLFTDGSCDPGPQHATGIRSGYGAVLYDPEDGALGMFGGYLGDEVFELLSNAGEKQQIVGQAELIPCLAAKQVWRKRLRGRLVVCYIDNDAARYGLIKGSSPTRDSAWLINEFWRLEVGAESTTWVDRVPSASNCADHPSRGRWRILPASSMKAVRVEISPSFEKKLASQWRRATSSGTLGPAPLYGTSRTH